MDAVHNRLWWTVNIIPSLSSRHDSSYVLLPSFHIYHLLSLTLSTDAFHKTVYVADK